MKHGILTTTLLISAMAVPAIAHAQETTNTEMKTITRVVGYKEKDLGDITIRYRENEEGLPARQISMEDAFDVLDMNSDGHLTKKEMFRFGTQPVKKAKRTNLVTNAGVPVQVDYYVHSTAPVIVQIDDKTTDGTFFSTMDTNGDNIVSKAEFKTNISVAEEDKMEFPSEKPAM